MAYTVVDKGSKHFNIILRNGGGGTFTGLGFQPDLVWQKARSSASSHYLHDAVRGVTKALFTNSTDGETTYTDQITSFDTDGFTVNAGGDWGSGTTVVDWCWKANGAGSSNTAGSISSTVSANTTAGFSIVSYTGNGNDYPTGATVGHGLGVAPKMIITKSRTESSTNWCVYHKSLAGADYVALLNSTAAPSSGGDSYNRTNPTSTVFSVGQAGGGSRTNGSGANYISYCFADVKGFSKAFSYTGNGSTDGTFVYLGFRPAYVLIKYTSGTGQDWYIWDNKRVTYNPNNNIQTTNTNQADTITSVVDLDILSNGFKCRNTNGGYNASGGNYIGIAFAENPFVTSKGIPVTAK